MLSALIDYKYIMSAQQLPCLQQLEQKVEKEAVRMSAKFKENELAEPAADQQPSKTQPEKETNDEVRLNLPQEAPPAAKANLFGDRPPSEPKINIFGNSKSVNLFSLSQQNNPQQSLNIFTNAMATSPAIALYEPDELSENSRGSDRSHQELKEPTERVMKYDYQQAFEKLGEFRVIKFRAGTGAVKECVLVSLQRETNKPEKMLHLVLRSEITKIAVYHAFLLPGVKPEQFMGKKENLKLTVLRLRTSEKKHEEAAERKEEDGEHAKQEEGEKAKQSELRQEREQVKLQFEKEEDAQAFETLLNEFFKKNE